MEKALAYWLKIRSVHFFWWTFSCLLAFNADRLLDPPYWDAVTGVYSQGLWLKMNHFDFSRLAQLPNYVAGGPRVHLLYAYAPLFAWLSSCFAAKSVFLLLHTLNLIFAAVTITVFFHILRSRLSFVESLVWILAAALNPVWSGQCAGIYLEIPLAALSALSFLFLWREQFFLAGLTCLFAYFIKSSAILQGFVYFIFAFLMPFFRKDHPSSGKRKFQQWLSLSAPFPLMLLMDAMANVKLRAAPHLFSQLRDVLIIVKITLPYLAATICLFGVLFVIQLRSKQWRDRMRQEPARPFLFCLALFVFSFWVGFVCFPTPLPRYTVSIYFPLSALFAFFLSNKRILSICLASLIIVVGVMTQNGSFLPKIPLQSSRDGHVLERSREFLKDVDGNKNLCRALERDYFDRPIVCKYPFTQMLTLPEFGYVQKPLPRVYGAGRFPMVSPALRWDENKSIVDSPGTVSVFCSNIYERSEPPSLLPGQGSRILYQDESLPGYLLAWTR